MNVGELPQGKLFVENEWLALSKLKPNSKTIIEWHACSYIGEYIYAHIVVEIILWMFLLSSINMTNDKFQ